MNIVLRIFILVSAALVLVFIVRKIRKSEFEIVDSIFWFFFAAVLVFLSVFPQVAYALSGLLGFDAPSNFVFLCVIAILIVRVFSLNAKLAHLRAKTNSLIQEIALREKE